MAQPIRSGARRRRPALAGALLLALTACFAAPAGAAEIYRWVDAEGQVHYGEHPPPEVFGERVDEPPPPPLSPEAAAALRERFEERHEAWRAERQAQLEQEQEAQAEAERRAQRCAEARGRVARLQLNRRIVDSSGNTLDDTERLARLEAARNQVAEHCD